MAKNRSNEPLTAESIAYWYLRLNGFLLLRNFLVHGDRVGTTRTDIDLLGVRFRYRREHLAQPMQDDEWIEREAATIVVFCDAKEGPQDFNASWANRDHKNMESFLALVGVTNERSRRRVANDLYGKGWSRPRQKLLITTLLILDDPHGLLNPRWPAAVRVQLRHALRFIHRRFYDYHNVKTPHGQWEPSGHALWDQYTANRHSEDKFVEEVLRAVGRG